VPELKAVTRTQGYCVGTAKRVEGAHAADVAVVAGEDLGGKELTRNQHGVVQGQVLALALIRIVLASVQEVAVAVVGAAVQVQREPALAQPVLSCTTNINHTHTK